MEAELPLPSPGTLFSLMPKCKMKRTMEWDKPSDWRYLTTNLSLSVEQLREQLRERFTHMEMCGVEPV